VPEVSDRNLEKLERAVAGKQTPLLVMDRGLIRKKFGELRDGFGSARICYALKTNPHWRIVDLLHKLGSDFEISSREELDLLLRRGIPADRIIASNPVKSDDCIRAAFAAGTRLFAVDSHAEIEKLSRLAPGSGVYVRLTVSNAGSRWPLTKKFGVDADEAVDLLCEARAGGLEPHGITFHVGSQNTESRAWMEALEQSRRVWDRAGDHGIELRMLNIGGGFPIKYEENSFSIRDMARTIMEAIDALFPESIDLCLEPGRVLVGEAGTLVGTVIGKASRNGERWLYLDVGVFNGLMESIGGIRYPMTSTRNGGVDKWVLAGPSCDSLDIVQTDVLLPDLEIGDRVYIESAGAYTTAYASRFDGVTIPRVTFV
jgi:ornithine decarboxylase